jgi:hypothetical protein
LVNWQGKIALTLMFSGAQANAISRVSWQIPLLATA